MASIMRMDKGTETGVLATMHACLREQHGDTDNASNTIIYGPSTSNQVKNLKSNCLDISNLKNW
jgi:hypothetical protein